MTVLLRGLLFAAGLSAASGTIAADLGEDGGQPAALFGRFRASCEDLGQFCFADACGGNQIVAALNCRKLCPSSVILEVVPGACLLPPRGQARAVLRRRG